MILLLEVHAVLGLVEVPHMILCTINQVLKLEK